MRPDIPFWTWVFARRLPVFSLVATLICVIGASMIARHTQSYISTAQILMDPNAGAHRSIDADSHFEFLKFRALTSDVLKTAASELSIVGDPASRVGVTYDRASGVITLHYSDQNPKQALSMARALSQSFLSTAQALDRDDAKRRMGLFTSEVAALRTQLMHVAADTEERRITDGLYRTALDNLAKASADVDLPIAAILTVVSEPKLARTPAGPNKRSMYLALITFAIFCGLVAVLVLEWLDTVIRRPADIERTLGFATFGVIPDLQLQPIDPSKSTARGL